MEYYGNLAYKPSAPKKTVNREQIQRKRREEERAQMMARKMTMKRIAYILVLALSATFMISKYVAVYDTQQEIKALNNKLEEKQSYTSQKIFQMEQKVDLAEVERKAIELGMQRPEKHQKIYVDVKTEDKTDVTAGDVEGIKNRSASFLDKAKKHILGVFGIQ